MQVGVLEPLNFSDKAKKDLKKYAKLSLFDGDDKKEFLKDKTILFIRLHYKIDRVFLQMAPKLKYICTPTTGLNHLDMNVVEEKQIKVLCLKGESEFLSTIRATPEHTLGLLLSLLRNYKGAFLSSKNSKWDRDLYKGFEIYGKTIGIVGMGRVGKILSKYFEALGAKVIYTDIIQVDAASTCDRVDDMKKLIHQSDIIFLTASYSKENEQMIDKNAIDLMQDKFFINTARGELVDEKYLIEKIKENYFKGIAIDVINNETDSVNNNLQEFLQLSDEHNFILTPHIAGATYESMWRTEEFIVEKLIKELK